MTLGMMTKDTANSRPTISDGKWQRQIWQPGDGNGDPNVDILETAQGQNNRKGHPTWKIFNGTIGHIKRGIKEPPVRCYLDDKAAYDISRSKVYTNVEKHRYWPFDFSVNGLIKPGRKNRGRPAYEPGSQNIIASVAKAKGNSPYYFYGAAGPPNAESSQQSPTPAPFGTAMGAQDPPASPSVSPKRETSPVMPSVEADSPEARTSPDLQTEQSPEKEGPRTSYATSARAMIGEPKSRLNFGNFMGAAKPSKRSSTVPRQVDRESVQVSAVSSPGGIMPENLPALPGGPRLRAPIVAPSYAVDLSDTEHARRTKRPRVPSFPRTTKRPRKDIQPSRSPSAIPGTTPQPRGSTTPQREPIKATFNSLKNHIDRLQEELDDNKIQCDTRMDEFSQIYRQLERLEEAQKNDQIQLAAVRKDLLAVEHERNDLLLERARDKGRLKFNTEEIERLKQDNEALEASEAALRSRIRKGSKASPFENLEPKQHLTTYREVATTLHASLANAKSGLADRHTALNALKKAIEGVGVGVEGEMREGQRMQKEVRRALGKAQEAIDDAGMAAEWKGRVGKATKH
ncbi:hypothetical protein W97_06238 [Coniosporium apollinis CBS 100218]|uniref:Uncharacterized protein n=1 Tax=Coniosporium apollinis (strain CBS 100218) TaxID=1168221 RepID=R7YYT7_CONA1|nr:uncharacterized protein W97_06238 [Coniosporium apollinis CBS 100218]EON66836.1 hypothetical protein W97_06238 [Coniosporium apollinis CBS 100218]